MRVRVLAVGCVAAVLLAAVALSWPWQRGLTVTAYFDKAVGVYAGSAVKVLGVSVGRIDSVVPQGNTVRVDLTVEPGVEIPAEVHAVVVAPSLVSDRYVQLAPAYESGPLLDGGAVIPRERTQVPVELDDLVGSVTELATALGPDGANANGALAGVLDTAAANLDGNGALLGDTVRQLSAAATTLSRSSGDLFATVDNLQRFTRLLADSDAQVRQFNDKLAGVTGYLAADRDELGAALGSLAGALTQVRDFVADNRAALSGNLDRLTGLTQVLVDQRAALAEILDVAPLAMSNFLSTYDAASASFAIRGNLNELTYPPMLMVCRTIASATPAQLPTALADLCARLAPVIDGTLRLPSVAEILAAQSAGRLPPLPLPVTDLYVPSLGGAG
jgi:phospholipid/cholesterol/gamma-HCH transport system substrate-binding protein